MNLFQRLYYSSARVKLYVLGFTCLFLYANGSLIFSFLNHCLLYGLLLSCGFLWLLPTELSFVTWTMQQEEVILSSSGAFSSSIFVNIEETINSWFPSIFSPHTSPSLPSPADISLPPPAPSIGKKGSGKHEKENGEKKAKDEKDAITPFSISSELYHLEYTKAHFFIFLIYYLPKYKLCAIGFLKKWFWAHQYEYLSQKMSDRNMQYLLQMSRKQTVSVQYTRAEIQKYYEEEQYFRTHNIFYQFLSTIWNNHYFRAVLISFLSFVSFLYNSQTTFTNETKEDNPEGKVSRKSSMGARLFEKAIHATDDLLEATHLDDYQKNDKVYTVEKAVRKASKYDEKKEYEMCAKWYLRAAQAIGNSQENETGMGEKEKQKNPLIVQYHICAMISLVRFSQTSNFPSCLLTEVLVKELIQTCEIYAGATGDFQKVAEKYEEIAREILKCVQFKPFKKNSLKDLLEFKEGKDRTEENPKRKLSFLNKLAMKKDVKEKSEEGGKAVKLSNTPKSPIARTTAEKFQIKQYTRIENEYLAVAAQLLLLAGDYYDKAMPFHFAVSTTVLNCQMDAAATYGMCGKYGKTTEIISRISETLYEEVKKGFTVAPGGITHYKAQLSEFLFHLAFCAIIQSIDVKEGVVRMSDAHASIPSKFHEYAMEPLTFLQKLLTSWHLFQGKEVIEKLRHYEERYHVLYDYEINATLLACEAMEYVDLK